MILATYSTFEQMHGRRSSIQEIVGQLSRFSRPTVLYACAVTGVLLKWWDNARPSENYNLLVDRAFESLRGNWYKLAARLEQPEFVFHRRQLLFIMKLAVEHCPEEGLNLLMAPRGVFGTLLLMANDHFYYQLYPFEGHGKADEFEKVLRLAAEFIPVNEYAGFRVVNTLTRAHLMATKYAHTLCGHPDFIDIAAEYKRLTDLPLTDYEALAFGLTTRCIEQMTAEAIHNNPATALVRPSNFHTTAIPKRNIEKFFQECQASPEQLLGSIQASREKGLDFGANDLTVFLNKPLIAGPSGSLPTDVLFVTKKFESGPYWRINNSSSKIGAQLRRFWGAVFEAYVTDLVKAFVEPGANALFIPNPHLKDDPNVEVCDGLLIEGSAMVVMEYKSNMFSGRAKYSGNYDLLRDEIASKWIKEKGAAQLRKAVDTLFAEPNKEVVNGLDVSKITHVYPLLITLDDLGGSLLITRLINMMSDKMLPKIDVGGMNVSPLLCVDIESMEVVLPYLPQRPLREFLQHWLDADPRLQSTFMAHFSRDGLQTSQNILLVENWKIMQDQIAERLFPDEYKQAKMA